MVQLSEEPKNSFIQNTEYRIFIASLKYIVM